MKKKELKVVETPPAVKQSQIIAEELADHIRKTYGERLTGFFLLVRTPEMDTSSVSMAPALKEQMVNSIVWHLEEFVRQINAEKAPISETKH